MNRDYWGRIKRVGWHPIGAAGFVGLAAAVVLLRAFVDGPDASPALLVVGLVAITEVCLAWAAGARDVVKPTHAYVVLVVSLAFLVVEAGASAGSYHFVSLVACWLGIFVIADDPSAVARPAWMDAPPPP